ncbi:MAG: (Fe-S)-binding protein [Alphaproteobacteria bacterium]|nr:(Fe-S)-binding protein [Alphaproteobacteria bacterium]
MTSTPERGGARPQVALFATCLLDLFRPSLGFAVARLLEEAGYEVVVPPAQTCCGQPNYNGGDRAGAIALARATIRTLRTFPHVVVPSGSCASMIRTHYPRLFEPGTPAREEADALAARTFELSVFLTEVAGWRPAGRRMPVRATYHDACSGLRELGIKAQPRKLLASVEGLELTELIDAEYCCGFGGTFCVKYPEISNRMVENKCADIEHSKAQMVIAGDLGCLLNMEGKLHRQGAGVRVCHFAEVLAESAGEEAP